MQSRRPAPLNVVPGDPEGTTWALPEGAVARLGKGFQRFNGSEIAISPDRTYFVVGTGVGLWWYDVPSMSPIALWETARGMISAVDFSPDGKWIATANWDGVVKMLDIQSGECVAQMKRSDEHNIYKHVVFSPDSKWIATANQEGIVEVLDLENDTCIAQMDWGPRDQYFNHVSQLDFSPDGQHVAATIDKTYVWNPRTNAPIIEFTGRNFAFSPDSRLLACENPYEIPNTTPLRAASTISVWNIATSERIANFTEHGNILRTITFSPCGQFLASSDRDAVLRVWDIAEGELKETYVDYGHARIEPIYLPDGTLLATVFTPETIEVWNVEQRHKLQAYERHPESIGDQWFSKCPELVITHTLSSKEETSKKKHTFSTLHEPPCSPYPVLFSSDGETLVIRGDPRGVVLWDVESKQPRKIRIKDELISTLTLLPCGDILAVNRVRDVFKVWRVGKTDTVPIGEFTSPTELGRHTFAFADDRIAFGGKGGTLYLWDLKHNEKPRSFVGHTDHIWSVAFSPDGHRLVSGSSDGTARLWDVELGEEIATLPLDRPLTTMALAFSPCSKIIVGGMNDEIRFWCAENLTTLLAIPQPQKQSPYALAFSPCGKYLASGTWWRKGMEKMAIRLWDVATGENIHTFCGHPTDIQSLAFSPDSTLLASGGFDGTILLWDVKPFIDV